MAIIDLSLNPGFNSPMIVRSNPSSSCLLTSKKPLLAFPSPPLDNAVLRARGVDANTKSKPPGCLPCFSQHMQTHRAEETNQNREFHCSKRFPSHTNDPRPRYAHVRISRSSGATWLKIWSTYTVPKRLSFSSVTTTSHFPRMDAIDGPFEPVLAVADLAGGGSFDSSRV